MKRILVIQDVSLWIDLNRHLSGVASVDLVEALSFETGQLLAQIERPEIVVYGAEGNGRGATEGAREFLAAGLTGIQVISIDPNASDVDDARTANGVPGRVIVCSPERLFGLVSELLDLTADEPDPTVELLAHYERDLQGGEVERGFAVILELTDRHIAFESDVQLETGCELRMNFFLVDPLGEAARRKISLSCIVAQCRDEAKLIYSSRVSKIEESAKRVLQQREMIGAGGPS